MLAPPPDLVLPGGGTCQVPDVAYGASWASGAARPPGGDTLLITYTDVCVHGTAISVQGFGVVGYRPGGNVLTGRTRLFSSPGGLPFQITSARRSSPTATSTCSPRCATPRRSASATAAASGPRCRPRGVARPKLTY